jgi:aspartokinase/homoserine dehydrogenase 1
MQKIVLKFGGSSLADADCIGRALEIIGSYIREGMQVLTVVSAMADTTNSLIRIADKAVKDDKTYEAMIRELMKKHEDVVHVLVEPDKRSAALSGLQTIFHELSDTLRGFSLLHEKTPAGHDLVLSCGERASALLFSSALSSRGTANACCDARNIIITDNRFGSARVLFDESEKRIREYFLNNDLPQVITGFIASTKKGETTTLGRSGSDYTASIIAAALDVHDIVIWTDVDGVMTADPRVTPDAFPIPSISYEDAMELSHFGAKVIFPPTMIPAMQKHIPIHIKNSFHPEHTGTVISPQGVMEDYFATGIASIDHVALIRVQGSGMIGVRGISARLFDCLARHEINIILITQASSEHSICFAIDADKADIARESLEETFQLEMKAGMIDAIVPEKETAIIAVVGDRMQHRPGIAAKIFGALGQKEINVKAISQGSSERNISIVIDRQDEHAAINALHRALFPIKEKTAVYLIGTGLVATALAGLLKDSDLQLNAVTNSRKMLYRSAGIDPAGISEMLEKQGEKADLEKFLKKLKLDPTPRKICVDCTASTDISARYHDILAMGVSLVTPNKIANTAPLEYYKTLRELSRKGPVQYKYEATVGAGLPVISTLRSMLETGDTVRRIEAILSGTLSYIFNTFSAEIPFSQVVRTAMENGYTEPDFREDLQGMDVARKALILAREIGYPLEMKDSVPQPLISEACRQAENLEKAIAELEKEDGTWHERMTALEKQGKVLRYIADIQDGKIAISVKEIDSTHPFYHLSGPDNIVAIYSDRYPINPLVIKGAGAGAVVTAGGIMSDILAITGNI